MSSLTKIVNSVPIISGLALSACQGESDMILVDYKCSKQEIYLISKAIGEWSEAADSAEMNIPLSLNFDSDKDPDGFLDWGMKSVEGRKENSAVIYKIKTTNPGYLTLQEEKGGVSFYGVAAESTYVVFVEDIIPGLVGKEAFKTYEEAFYYVALHEFGHFFGLPHLSSPHSIMAGEVYVGVETCIDEETLENYCNLKECGPNKHPTCKYEIEVELSTRVFTSGRID
ncbi:MAG: matrixin family metalloprotease [Nanoarchaeota archaeon]